MELQEVSGRVGDDLSGLKECMRMREMLPMLLSAHQYLRLCHKSGNQRKGKTIEVAVSEHINMM
jgi:hypothetical protein